MEYRGERRTYDTQVHNNMSGRSLNLVKTLKPIAPFVVGFAATFALIVSIPITGKSALSATRWLCSFARAVVRIGPRRRARQSNCIQIHSLYFFSPWRVRPGRAERDGRRSAGASDSIDCGTPHASLAPLRRRLRAAYSLAPFLSVPLI